MHKSLVLPVFFLMIAVVGISQQPLGYRLRQGEVFTLEQHSEQLISQELEEAVHEIKNRVDAVLEFRVVEVRDSTFLLAFTFRDLIFKIESNIQGELLHVSARERDEADLQSRIFHSLLDSPVSFELSKSGDVLKVKGGDSLVGKMVAAAGLESGPAPAELRASLIDEYGSEALAATFRQLTYFYPAHPVRPGDTWSTRHNGKMEAITTWSLDSTGTGGIHISGTADIRLLEADPGTELELKGRQQTTIRVEPGSGFIRDMKIKGEARGTSRTQATGQMEIPTQIRTQTTYSLIDHRHVQ